MRYRKKYSSRFSNNSETFASELLENPQELVSSIRKLKKHTVLKTYYTVLILENYHII